MTLAFSLCHACPHGLHRAVVILDFFHHSRALRVISERHANTNRLLIIVVRFRIVKHLTPSMTPSTMVSIQNCGWVSPAESRGLNMLDFQISRTRACISKGC